FALGLCLSLKNFVNHFFVGACDPVYSLVTCLVDGIGCSFATSMIRFGCPDCCLTRRVPTASALVRIVCTKIEHRLFHPLPHCADGPTVRVVFQPFPQFCS